MRRRVILGFLQKTTLIFPIFWAIPYLLNAQCINNPSGYANVVLNEISGDAGQSDGANDGIVEIAGPPGWDIGCMVVTNTEWVVVIPNGTTIPADGIYVIACGVGSEGAGVGLTDCGPASENGLACSDCDFPSLPIDLDVCDPSNGAFYDPAASGFTIDNQNDGDGDQVILFTPDGTPHDALYWGEANTIARGGMTIGGSSGDADHVWVQLLGNTYLLGDNDEDGIVNNNAGGMSEPGGTEATRLPSL